MFKKALTSRSISIGSARFFSSYTSCLQKVTLTFFGKEECGLCDQAKLVVDEVIQSKDKLKNQIDLKYIDITHPMNKQWWDAYCFDVPVVHFDRFNQENPVKMMHRLNKKQIIEEIEK